MEKGITRALCKMPKPQSHRLEVTPPLCFFFLQMVAKYKGKWGVTGVHMGITVHLIKSP